MHRNLCTKSEKQQLRNIIDIGCSVNVLSKPYSKKRRGARMLDISEGILSDVI